MLLENHLQGPGSRTKEGCASFKHWKECRLVPMLIWEPLISLAFTVFIDRSQFLLQGHCSDSQESCATSLHFKERQPDSHVDLGCLILTHSYLYASFAGALPVLLPYVKLRVAHAPGMPGNFSPHRRLVIPTCITARACHTCCDVCRGR